MHLGYAVYPRCRPAEPFEIRDNQLGRQVERREDRHTGRGKVRVEVMAVQMNNIDLPMGNRGVENVPVVAGHPAAFGMVQTAVHSRCLQELPGDGRALTCDDNGTVATRNETPVD